MKSDFNFIDCGWHISLMPNTAQATAVWNEIAQTFAGGNIPPLAWPSVKHQIKAAGYTIRKARKTKISADDLLAALTQ